MARGFFAGKVLWVVGGIVVLIFYGGILWGLLPRPGISWTGHVFGAVGGVLAAWYVHGREPDDEDLAVATQQHDWMGRSSATAPPDLAPRRLVARSGRAQIAATGRAGQHSRP